MTPRGNVLHFESSERSLSSMTFEEKVDEALVLARKSARAIEHVQSYVESQREDLTSVVHRLTDTEQDLTKATEEILPLMALAPSVREAITKLNEVVPRFESAINQLEYLTQRVKGVELTAGRAKVVAETAHAKVSKIETSRDSLAEAGATMLGLKIEEETTEVRTRTAQALARAERHRIFNVWLKRTALILSGSVLVLLLERLIALLLP